MAYTDRRGSEYGASLSSSGSVGRLGSGPDHHDTLSIHQALQNAVDDQEQNQVCDESATTFMTDLPLLKSKLKSCQPGVMKMDTSRYRKRELFLMGLLAGITRAHIAFSC